MVSEDSTLALRNPAFEIGIHHTTLWTFLKGELNLLIYELKTN